MAVTAVVEEGLTGVVVEAEGSTAVVAVVSMGAEFPTVAMVAAVARTVVAALMEARVEIRRRDVVPRREGPGRRKAEGFVTRRPDGIRSEDPVVGAWRHPARRLRTGAGTPSEASTLGLATTVVITEDMATTGGTVAIGVIAVTALAMAGGVVVGGLGLGLALA